MEISIIIPTLNSSITIVQLINEIIHELKDYHFEIILVNDGSTDDTALHCENLSKNNNKIINVELRKNFGEHNAVMCGLNFAKGKYCIIMDDDFQNPPSQIHLLINEIKKGFDVVYSKYDKKQHSFFRNLFSHLHNKMAVWLLKKPKGIYLSSFKAIHKDVISEIIKYKGPFPYIDGLILRTTNHISQVATKHDKRKTGKSNYTIRKLLKLYFNMFFNFSIIPIRFFIVLGTIAFAGGGILSLYFIINKLIHPNEITGWTSTIVIVLLLSGLQLIFLGLIGEYIGKTYLDQNQTPQWVIRKKMNNETSE